MSNVKIITTSSAAAQRTSSPFIKIIEKFSTNTSYIDRLGNQPILRGIQAAYTALLTALKLFNLGACQRHFGDILCQLKLFPLHRTLVLTLHAFNCDSRIAVCKFRLSSWIRIFQHFEFNSYKVLSQCIIRFNICGTSYINVLEVVWNINLLQMYWKFYLCGQWWERSVLDENIGTLLICEFFQKNP